MTLNNERLHRTHHRSLAPCPFVYETTETTGNQIRVVGVSPNVPVYDTHAGGREIHIHPEFLLPQLSQLYSGSREDPLRRHINPRRFLTESDLELLRRFFPALNAVSEQPQEKNRQGPLGTLQKAIVEGTEYLWDRKARTQSIALLWRAMHDDADVEGRCVVSGSARGPTLGYGVCLMDTIYRLSA